LFVCFVISILLNLSFIWKVHFEWDSVDLEMKLKIEEELAADKEVYLHYPVCFFGCLFILFA
jgi:hypothetical protein